MSNPYQAPQDAASSSDQIREPNTWLTNWSVLFASVFFFSDGFFLLYSLYRENPFKRVFAAFVIAIVVLAPTLLMLLIDGMKSIRVAPKRVFITLCFATIIIVFGLAQLES